MLTVAEILNRALAHHRAGRLREAEQLYRQVLAVDENSFDACYGLAVALHAQGSLPEAVACFQRSVRLRPDHADARLDLGIVLGQSDSLDESVASLQEAARLAPESVEIAELLRQTLAMQQNRLAEDFVNQGQLEQAAACCRKAVELTPKQATTHENLGRVLTGQGNLDEAAACYRRAIELDDRSVEAHYRLGLIAMRQRRFEDAAVRFRRTLELKPELVEAYNQLGSALTELERCSEAETCFRRLLELQPGHAEGRNNLGAVLAKQQKLSEAADWFQRALHVKPDYAEAHFNLAGALADQNQFEDAVPRYRRAMELKPDYAEAQAGLGLTLLGMGKLAEGWPHYEARWQTAELKDVPQYEPRWTGQDLAGRTILLGREQGFGDTLQFVRYAELVQQRGGTVIVECLAPMAKLVATCPFVDRVVFVGDPLPSFDFFVPLVSLPGVFGTTLENVPANVPYLWPDATLVDEWRDELGHRQEMKIGIAWQGNPAHRSDRRRSIPLEQFEPIVRAEGIRLYSLQMGSGREQLAEVARNWPLVDLGQRLGDFHNTAAIVRNLDLVITCDTAPAHLAGALGIPVWVALAFAPDWRWMRNRPDSPWYPTMRLFRQRQPGQWADVFARIADELDGWLAGGPTG